MKKVVFVPFLPDMLVVTPLFVRDRCHYVGRDVTLKMFCEFKK